MRTGAETPPTAAGASDTVPDTVADTPSLAEPRQRSRRGGRSRPFPRRWCGSGRPVQDEKPEQRQRKRERGGLTPPTAVFLTPLPICASDCARPRTRPPLRPRRGPDDVAPSDRHLGGGQPDGGPRRRAIDGPARRRPGGCALGELAQAQEPIEREEQQVSTETNERDEERTDQVGNEHGHERDQSARRIGDRAASTTDRGRAGHAGKQAPGHGGRPQAAERAGNFDHTCAPARQPAQQRLTRGDNFPCAELAMTPVRCHSQPTQCAYIGNLARGSCVPLRTPTAARLSPAHGRAGGVAPLLPGGALTADSPHCGCRRPRVVGEARRPAGAAGVACARPWSGRRGRFRPRWRGRSGGRRDHRLAAVIIAPHKVVAGLTKKRAEIIVDTVFGNINEVTRRSPAVVGPGRR